MRVLRRHRVLRATRRVVGIHGMAQPFTEHEHTRFLEVQSIHPDAFPVHAQAHTSPHMSDCFPRACTCCVLVTQALSASSSGGAPNWDQIASALAGQRSLEEVKVHAYRYLTALHAQAPRHVRPPFVPCTPLHTTMHVPFKGGDHVLLWH